MISGRALRTATRAPAVALLLLLASGAPALAECVQFDPWPSFEEAAPTAERIVVGKVVAGYAFDSASQALTFRLRVDEVIRGQAATILEFRDVVRSGAPLKLCTDSMLTVRVGDTLAMAFDAHVAGVRGPVLAVAFLNRTPDQFSMPGIQHVSLRDVHRMAAGLPPTDAVAAATAAPGPAALPVGALPLEVAAAAVGLALAWRRTRPPRVRRRT